MGMVGYWGALRGAPRTGGRRVFCAILGTCFVICVVARGYGRVAAPLRSSLFPRICLKLAQNEIGAASRCAILGICFVICVVARGYGRVAAPLRSSLFPRICLKLAQNEIGAASRCAILGTCFVI